MTELSEFIERMRKLGEEKHRSELDAIGRIRQTLRVAALAAGMTQEEIGIKMGLAKKDARKAVSRLLNLGIPYDPRLSTLLKFAAAIEYPLKDLL